jgi:hypothetical protein
MDEFYFANVTLTGKLSSGEIEQVLLDYPNLSMTEEEITEAF